VAGVPNEGTAIVGVDDEWCSAIAVRLARSGKRVVRISAQRRLSNGLYAEHQRIMRADGADAAAIAELAGIGSLRGRHNAQNAACATAAALTLGIEPAAIQAGLKSFPGLAHRMEEVGRMGRVLLINDSKATNADSAAQALACFSDIFWIAGGKPKTGGIEPLRQFFPRIRKAYLIGEAAEEFAATLGAEVPHEIDRTLDKALAAALRDAQESAAPEPVVLLSPACASFDQYRNFELRGDAFRDLVRALPGIAARNS
jgi:UDP-N-acetylmuramoylalanine--D-glutamate ligase